MKKILCVLMTIVTMATLLIGSAFAAEVISNSEDFTIGDLSAQTGQKDGDWALKKDSNDNQYLNCAITSGQTHYDIKCSDILEDSIYLAFDICLEDTNYSVIEMYGTPEVGSSYTLYHFGYIEGGKLVSYDRSSSVDISTGAWHTIEFFFDIVNEKVYVYLDGQEAFSFNPYASHVGETKFTYCDHLRVHMKGDGRGTAVIKLDNFKLGTYDKIGGGNNEQQPDGNDDNQQGSPETADHVAIAIVAVAVAAGAVLAANKRRAH